jgi:Sulfatase
MDEPRSQPSPVGRVFSHPLVLAAGLLLAYFIVNSAIAKPMLGAFLRTGNRPLDVVTYLALCSASGLSLALALIAYGRWAAAALGSLALVCLGTNYSVAAIAGVHPLDPPTAQWLFGEIAHTGDAIHEFSGAVARSFAFAALLALPFAIVVVWARRRMRPRLTHNWRLPLGITCTIAYLTSSYAMARQFVDDGPLDSNLFAFYVLGLQERVPETGKVDLPLVATATAVTKIVLVVDESVDHEVYESQVLPTWAPLLTADFGEAASTGNCSASSNALLRWGFRADELLQRHDPRAWPSIWGYARGAGYRTIFIDGQRRGAYQNFMRHSEAALIDQTISVSAGFDTDTKISETLQGLLRSPGRMFIYVNKRGAHFPYRDHFPAGLIPTGASRDDEYVAAVRYSSGNFLAGMLAGANLENALVVYTSDHGQYHPEKGQRGESLHCNRYPHSEELSVPLAVVTAAQPFKSELSESARRNQNQTRHTQIFPTLLIAMGYESGPAEAEYGASLLSPQPPDRYYYSVGG